jgi:hypothetical protein
MNFRLFVHYALLPAILVSTACSNREVPVSDTDGMALVSVSGKILYKQELDGVIPKGLSPTDSTLAAEAYIKMWIKNELMYEKAKENLTDREKIDELVDNYRHSLTIYTYQEQLLKEHLSKDITDRELRDYYERYPEQFKLETNIIKGLFLKVPVSSPRLEDLKKWYVSTSEKAIENIEKYSLQNAVIYDYFYNKWVDFDDVMNNIPRTVADAGQFLKDHKRLEVQDSTYVYLLNIKDYALTGSKSPFEFARTQILDILVSHKRDDFMKEFENDLYEKALANDAIKFYVK